MFNSKQSDSLLEDIREGRALSTGEKLNLIYLLSIPSILAQITSVMMFFIDQAMVGRIGVEAAAACGLVETSTWLCGSLASAASMGFSVQVAHFIGANDFGKAREVFRHGLGCCLAFSVAMALAGLAIAPRLPYWLGGGADIAHDATTYFAVFMLVQPFFQLNGLAGAMLKCSGNMRVPSIMSIAICVMDVGFNYIFIFIFHLGVLGVALGTALAIVIGACVQAYFAIFRSPILSLFLEARDKRQAASGERQETRVGGQYVVNALKISLPMAAQSLLMSGAQIVSTIIVAPLGNIAIAANTFAITAESLCYMPGYGIGMVVMAVMGAVMFITAPQLMALMTPEQSIIDLGAAALRIEAFAEPFFAASIVSYSVFVGAGDTLKPAVMNLCSMWFVRLTLAAWLARDYGLRGVWTAMAIELTFRGLLFLFRLFRGKWAKGSAA